MNSSSNSTTTETILNALNHTRLWSLLAFAYLLMGTVPIYTLCIFVLRKRNPIKAHGIGFMLLKLFSILLNNTYLGWYGIVSTLTNRPTTGLSTALIPFTVFVYSYPTILHIWKIILIFKLNQLRVELFNFANIIPNQLVVPASSESNCVVIATPSTPKAADSRNAESKSEGQINFSKEAAVNPVTLKRRKIKQKIRLVKHLLSCKFQFAIFIMICTVVIMCSIPSIVIGILAMIYRNSLMSNVITLVSLFVCSASQITLAIFLCILVIIGRKLNVKESHGIIGSVISNIFCLIICATILFLQMLLLIITNSSIGTAIVTYVGAILVMVNYQVDTFNSIGIPIFRTICKRNYKSKNESSNILQYIMSQNDLKISFENFVKQEWSLENLLFLQRFENWNLLYHKPVSIQEKILFLEQMNHDFLTLNGPFALNIKANASEIIDGFISQQNLEKAHQELQVIKKSVEMLMMDTIHRYCAYDQIFKQHCKTKKALDQSFVQLQW